MSDLKKNSNGEKKSHGVLILLIVVGLVAFSNAIKDLNQAQLLAVETGRMAFSYLDSVVPTASARTPAACVEKIVQDVRSDDFKWKGVVSPGANVEVKGINGEIVAEPASGSEVEVVATKRARRSDVDSVQIKVVEHAGGVTICAVYPNESGQYSQNCGTGEQKSGGSVRHNDVQVSFRVKVPYGVGFIGKTVNGHISATSLNGNVVTRTINGGIKISTTGYAEATTINGEIAATLGDGNWTKSLSFTTTNGEINLVLPAGLSTDLEAQTLNGTISSDFPLNVTTLSGRKSVRGTIGAGGRNLIVRTLNGSINLRAAG